MQATTIALLTDFGTHDVYVGVMKGIIAQIAPDARLIDLTHEIPPGDVRAGAFRLWQAHPFMPPGTVFLAVVDPGVGTVRRPVAVSAQGFICVGPDNGLFTYLLARCSDARAVELAGPGDARAAELHAQALHGPAVSATFHGRDIFAPAAARLAAGLALGKLGPEVADLTLLPYPCLELASAREGWRDSMPRTGTLGGAARDSCASLTGLAVRGEVLCTDRFGNLVTSIGALRRAADGLRLEPWLPTCPAAILPATGLRARLENSAEFPFASTYGDVSPGSPLAYVGSDGLLEIGVNRGRAVDLFPLVLGAEVILF